MAVPTAISDATAAASRAVAPLRGDIDALVSAYLAEVEDQPERADELRQALARQVRGVDVDVDALSAVLDDARDAGRAHAGGAVAAVDDATLDGAVDDIHDRALKALAEAAATLDGAELDTDTAAALVDRIGRDTTTAAQWAATRSVNRGVVEGTIDDQLVFVPEREACLWCTSFAGAVADKGGTFHPVLTFASRTTTAIPYPPVHRHCRCEVRGYTPTSGPTDEAEALRREARRSLARGMSDYDSTPARLRATAELLERNPDLPASVIAAAKKAVKSGEFKAPPK